jgi:hypothetical protein
MSVSIGNTVATLATGSIPSSIARTQNSLGADADPAPQGLTAIDPAAAMAPLPASAWKVLEMTNKLGSDANDIATALVPSMQTLIQLRPDLANQKFDFSYDNGGIKVTSNTMNASNQAWVQFLLNSNDALTTAVQTFHDDTVAGYAAAAEAKAAELGQPPPDAGGEDSGSGNVDVNFMQLFRKMGADAGKSQYSRDTYTTLSGANVDLSQDPGSAAGLLGFVQSAQALAEGAVKDVDSSGRAFYGTRQYIFMDFEALPQLFQPATKSLGIHVTA